MNSLAHPLMQEASEFEALDASLDLSNGGSTGLWMERGFSRRDIGKRILAAVPELRLFTSAEQSIPGATVLPYPDFNPANPAASLDDFNALIDRHQITDLWPQRSAVYDLSPLNSTVHVPATPAVIRLVDDKVAFTQWLGDDPYRLETSDATGVEAVAEIYYRRKAQGKETCVKPSFGVNGEGYWRLTEENPGSLLKDPAEREIHPDIYFAALALKEKASPPKKMAVMEWLPGPEVSVDLLCWEGSPLVHAARTKIDTYHQRVQSEHPVLEHTHKIAARLALHGIVSMQYRLDSHGRWKMLEVNPRPAGGSIYSEDAGFGIISEWARLVAGRTEPDLIQQPHDDVLLRFDITAHRITE